VLTTDAASRHHAHQAPLAFKAIMTVPQPMAFSALGQLIDDPHAAGQALSPVAKTVATYSALPRSSFAGLQVVPGFELPSGKRV
jgi:hypothetical protein